LKYYDSKIRETINEMHFSTDKIDIILNDKNTSFDVNQTIDFKNIK
jgi:hypothetical protein